MSLEIKKDFLTIEYEFYNPHSSRVQEKKIKLFSEVGKGKDKKTIMPPTTNDIFSQKNNIPIFEKKFDKHLGDFWFKEPNEETKKLLKKKIEDQKTVMDTIEHRVKHFNYTCGLIKAGTGAGKTVIAIKISKLFQSNTLILVSNLKLLNEMYQSFIDFTTMSVGRFGDGYKEIEPITICTKISFAKNYEEICKKGNYEVLIVDECHTAFSDKVRDAINIGFDKKEIAMYGLSATPFTPELTQEHLERYFGAMIDIKGQYEIIPDFEFIDYEPQKIIIDGKEESDYIYENYAELRGKLAQDEVRFQAQIKELSKMYKERNFILVLTDRIYESNHFYKHLAKGDRSKFNLIKITGETKVEDDEKQLKEAINNGKKTIIVGAIQKLGEGFNCPPIDTVFLVSAIKWKGKVEQSVGRALRSFKKLKPKVILWNDGALKRQKTEKIKAIKDTYGIDKKDIKIIKIGDKKMPHEKVKINFTSIV